MKQRQKLELPMTVVLQLKRLRELGYKHPFRVYLGCLYKEGWTIRSMSRALGMSQQGISYQVSRAPYIQQSLEEYRLICRLTLPVPPVPDKPQKPKKPKRQASDEVVAMMKKVAPAANRYRNGSQNWKAAELYVALAWYAIEYENATCYALAKQLDVNQAGLRSRLARYGYLPTKGKSSSLRPIDRSLGRKPRTPASHCRRGHELLPGNVYLLANGSRVCKACDRIRSERYQNKRKALALGGGS